ncbi:Nucleoporin nup84, partial [Tulasnella sp. 408]
MDKASLSYGQTIDALKAMQNAKKSYGEIVQEGTDMYHRLCQEMYNEVSKTNGDEYYTPAELELIRLERDTWSLVRALYIDKNEPPTTSATPQALLQRNPYTPTVAIVQRVMDHEPTLQRLLTVVNWLHDTAPAASTSTHQSGYRRRTQREIVGARQAGQARAGLPKSLDPDALNRESGVSLYPDDAAAEASLSYDLFRLVRAGRLNEALSVAADAGHPWLAAVLHGSRPFQWTAVTSRDAGADSESEANASTAGWQGNKRRKLWREACLQAAASPTYPPATRALYASLCLTSRSIPAVTPLLRTWEDHLWARVEMLLTERIADWLDHLGGFWENGMKASDPQSSAKLQDLPDENQWLGDVDKLVREMGNVRVEEGAASDNAFHFAQLHLVLGNVNGLLDQVASTCTSRAEQDSREPVPTPAVDVILNEYIRLLETDPSSGPLVALYVGALGESAVE